LALGTFSNGIVHIGEKQISGAKKPGVFLDLGLFEKIVSEVSENFSAFFPKPNV